MDSIKISPVFKTVPKRNPISGHRWNESIPTGSFQVIGGKFCTTLHRSIESAEKEVATRKRITELIDEMKAEGLL